MIFAMFIMGCNDKNNIKEEIVVLENLEQNPTSKSASPKLTLWLPDVSDDPDATKTFQTMVGSRLQMPAEMQQNLEVYTPGNRCTIVRDPITKICAAILKREETWEIQQIGMKLEPPLYPPGTCYNQKNTLDNISKDDEVVRRYLGIIDTYCKGS